MSSFHNGTNYEYYFIIKELAELFFQNLPVKEITLKKITIFTVLIEKEPRRTDKNGEDFFVKNISFILQFLHINSARFMASLLPNLFNNLSTRIYEIICKCRHNDKKICKLLE